jgi:uncharacterized protein
VLGAAFFAGFVDAIVGGGGLIQVPALFAVYPAVPPPVLLGTNKLGGICGTTGAVMRYARIVRIPWRALLPAVVIAFFAALAGAGSVNAVSPETFRPLVPVMLTVVLCYVLWNKDLGASHAPVAFSRRRAMMALAAIGGIGFYDGFFGPGTGSFLMLLFIRLYGFDFLHASAGARTVNVATNAGALLFFGIHGEIHWALGFALGACNAAGGVAGAHMAVKHGSRFVRGLFIAIVTALIAKTGVDSYAGWAARASAAFPVPGLHAPAVALANPLMGDPVVSGFWRRPVAVDPHMPVANPVPVSPDPHVSR